MQNMLNENEFTYLKGKNGNTRYIVNGSSNPEHAIVFVCGISSHSYSYFHLVNAISKIYPDGDHIQYIRYDMYGRGKSDNPSADHTSDLFVDQLHELINGIVIKPRGEGLFLFDDYVIWLKLPEKRPRITVIGFSMGGCVSVHFAAKHSDLVDDLILFSSVGATWKLPFGSSLVKVPWLGNIVYGALHRASTDEQKVATGLFDLKDQLVQERMKYNIEIKNKENDHDSQVTSFINTFT